MAAIPVGDLSGVDVIAELPYSNNPHSTAVKAFTTISGFDLSTVVIYKNTNELNGLYDETITGITFKGDLKLGIYGEMVNRFSNKVFSPSRADRYDNMQARDIYKNRYDQVLIPTCHRSPVPFQTQGLRHSTDSMGYCYNNPAYSK